MFSNFQFFFNELMMVMNFFSEFISRKWNANGLVERKYKLIADHEYYLQDPRLILWKAKLFFEKLSAQLLQAESGFTLNIRCLKIFVRY